MRHIHTSFLRNLGKQKYLRGGVFSAAFALIGVAALQFSHASTSTASIEAEAGVKSCAATVSDSTASASGAAKFANAGTSCTNTLGSLPRIPWEGGANYYSQFSKASVSGWSNPSFFPIGVYFGKPSQAAALKAVGVNTFYGAEHDGSTIASMTGQGMYVIAQDEWTQAQIGTDQRVVGYFISDECDIGLGCSGGNAAGDLAQQQAAVNKVKAYNDGRFTTANYSNGILQTFWAVDTIDDLLRIVDAASNDKYMYTSSFVQGQAVDSSYWPSGANPATSAAYGWQIDRMRALQSPAGVHPNWIFIESAMPFLNETDSTVISVEQLEGANWSSIIHEARGIMYFQHNNSQDMAKYHPNEPIYANCGEYSLVDCDATRLAKIKVINDTIQSFAPILNTQSYQWSFNATTDTMLKTYQGSAYIFAGIGLKQATGSKTFTLPTGITGTSVEVVGENRTLPISNRTFSDSFAAEYSHHTYKIAL